jgi:hypothetical protein
MTFPVAVLRGPDLFRTWRDVRSWHNATGTDALNLRSVSVPADIDGLVTGAMLKDPIFWIAIAVTVAGLVAVAIYIARD